MTQLYDCIVLGAGPAGTTVAALVAASGYRTLLVERQRRPGSRIGQALLPVSAPVLDRLGVLSRLEHGRFVRRQGLCFVNAAGEACPPFEDSNARLPGWHIRRSDFDPLLMENAERLGAEVWRDTTAREVLFDANRAWGVRLEPADRAECVVRGSVIVDATGQQTLIDATTAMPAPLHARRKGAIWGEYRSSLTPPDRAATLVAQTRGRQSWFWYIPLAEGRVSVGVVGDIDALFRGRGRAECVFEEELVQCPLVAERLMHAQLTHGLWSTRKLFYNSPQVAGDGWVLVGDSLAAVDPILFAGVLLALESGQRAADAIVAALAADDVSAERLGRWGGNFLSGVERMRKLAEVLYDPRFDLAGFVRRFPHHHATLAELFAGRVFETNADWLLDDLELFLHFGRELAASSADPST